MKLHSLISTLAVCTVFAAFGQVKQKSVIKASVTKPAPPPEMVQQAKYPKGSVVLKWDKPVTEVEAEGLTADFLFFKGASYDPLKHYLPKYSAEFKLEPGANEAKINLVNPIYEPLTPAEVKIARAADKFIPEDITLEHNIIISPQKSRIYLSFIPIRKTAGGQYEKLVSFSLDVKQSNSETARRARHSISSFTSSSVLANGKWYKIGVTNDGVYKLDYAFFKDMGFNMSTHPANIRIYGNGGYMLPDSNKTPRLDDLVENAIYVQGQTDSSFGTSDYVLFYGQSTAKWTYNNTDKHFHHQVNLYSDTTYYFITGDLGPGKRIQNETVSVTPTDTVNSFDDYGYHEQDAENLIQSGNKWFGETFDIVTSYNISFYYPNILTNVQGYVNVSVASRDCSVTSTYQIGPSTTFTISAVGCGQFDAYAGYATGSYNFTPTGPSVNVNISKLTASAVGWLGYVETNVRRSLTMTSGTLEFRDMNSVGAGKVSLFNLASGLPISLWDVSNPQNVMSVPLTSVAGGYKFILPTDSLKQFVAYDGSTFATAKFMGTVANQNLHAMPQADLVIVTNPQFITQAQQLAAFHTSHDGLKVNVATTNQVYNEFSSGRQDPIAIRDFMRMFHTRATNYANAPKYLLLFGGASYDPKHRVQNNTNYVVSYESDESFGPTTSFVSDDYFAVLDSNEGPVTGNNYYALTISVGRLPVASITDANTVLNKIISYETPSGEPAQISTNCCTTQGQYNMGNWRNTVCFIAHDGDGGEHERNADALARYVTLNYPNINVNKIYCDAYPVVQTPGGERYPTVNTAIDNQMDQGALIMNFTGHGGVLGLAFQRILTFNDIYAWNNTSKLSLFFTASCEFAKFDNPAEISAGQLCLTTPNGGNIGLMTTTRAVYAAPNQDINQAFFNYLYTKLPDSSMPRTGDLFRWSKDTAIGEGNYLNSLMFSYLGDPAVRLNYPQERVYTSTINSAPVSATADTLRALSKVTVTGYVGDPNGNPLSNYSNGILYATIYDKPDSVYTLDNPNSSNPPNIVFPFALQNSILYRGRISVNNGKFSFSFVVPKDINYKYGLGKISYYAQNGVTDATGNYQKIIIGGSSPTAYNTGKGPQVRLYLNDSNFVFGGTTNENPQMLGLVFDTNGINLTTNSIGHDITAILDNNTQNTYDLTNYYQPYLNSYQKGTITYPFSNLSPGKHSLTLRVWNVYNNESQAYTEFNVTPKANLQLNHVLNYPNPFTTHTQFYFEINEVCDVIDVQIQIFTISGKLIRNILTSVKSDSFRSQPIDWDGRDDYGDKIGNGVYIYHLRVRTSEGTTAETYQKLVIL